MRTYWDAWGLLISRYRPFGPSRDPLERLKSEDGVPERIRTSDLRFRKPLLYPAELRGHAVDIASSKFPGTCTFDPFRSTALEPALRALSASSGTLIRDFVHVSGLVLSPLATQHACEPATTANSRSPVSPVSALIPSSWRPWGREGRMARLPPLHRCGRSPLMAMLPLTGIEGFSQERVAIRARCP